MQRKLNLHDFIVYITEYLYTSNLNRNHVVATARPGCAKKIVPFSQIDINLLADFGLLFFLEKNGFSVHFSLFGKTQKTVRLISVVRVVNGIQVVQVVKVACFDDMYSESIWFTWCKPSDY